MRILVTGGAGFIGSHFVRHLLRTRPGVELVNLDKLTYAGHLANLADLASDSRYHFVKGDVCDPAAVEQAIAGCSALVHFAAESHVDRSIYDPVPAIRTNITGTLTLLMAARKVGVGRFMHVSTDEVYGDIPAGQSASEDAPLAPNSPYSVSKAGADLLVRSFIRTYKVPAIIARPCNNYGPNQFPEKFLPLIIANALEGRALPVYGDGKQERTWLHVEDTCAALGLILEHGRIGEIYNIGSDTTHENIALVREVLKLTGRPESLIEHIEDRPGHDRRYALNSAKLRNELHWSPVIGLSEGLAETMRWYRRNTAWLEQIRRGEYRDYYDKYYSNRSASLESIRRPIASRRETKL
jgi:dTDP-glucose 4,6-dehydratase